MMVKYAWKKNACLNYGHHHKKHKQALANHHFSSQRVQGYTVTDVCIKHVAGFLIAKAV